MREKRNLRKEFLQKRAALSELERERAENAIFERMIQLPAYQAARSVMLFVSFGTECDTHRLIQFSLSEGKQVLVPYCDPDCDEMCSVPIQSMKELVPGKHGILAPAKGKTAQNPAVDFILTPGLAFDWEGYRLGYGRGYYDRFFDSLPDSAVRVGIGFDFQVVSKLPHDSFDRSVHAILTEKQTIYIESN
jgi:5-formyltetrahydrofolate cyclo-ligase